MSDKWSEDRETFWEAVFDSMPPGSTIGDAFHWINGYLDARDDQEAALELRVSALTEAGQRLAGMIDSAATEFSEEWGDGSPEDRPEDWMAALRAWRTAVQPEEQT